MHPKPVQAGLDYAPQLQDMFRMCLQENCVVWSMVYVQRDTGWGSQAAECIIGKGEYV